MKYYLKLTQKMLSTLWSTCLQVIVYHHCLRWTNTVKSSQEREAGTDYSRNGNLISEIEEWNIIWSWLKRCFRHCGRPDLQAIVYDQCLRWINTVKSSQEREAGTDYSGNGNQISELECWVVIWSRLKWWFGDYDRPVLRQSICLPALAPLDQYGKK